MSVIVPAFQFEIRYNHILNFSQIARKVIAPYVKLAQGLKVENQNTLNEKIILNFEDENYFIIVGWDRILIKGQHNLETYTSKNSPIEMPFFAILEKIKEFDEFGSIQNSLFAINYIRKLNIPEKDINSHFHNKFLLPESRKVLENSNDIAIMLEDRKSEHETTISFGPYMGTLELTRRPMVPVDIESLGDTNFIGLMLEYKHAFKTNEVSFDDFVEMTKTSNKIFDRTWKML